MVMIGMAKTSFTAPKQSRGAAADHIRNILKNHLPCCPVKHPFDFVVMADLVTSRNEISRRTRFAVECTRYAPLQWGSRDSLPQSVDHEPPLAIGAEAR
jgi:hypothetical protein